MPITKYNTVVSIPFLSNRPIRIAAMLKYAPIAWPDDVPNSEL